MCPEYQRGFVLPTAIFLLVVMASLAAVMVRLTSASQAASSQDMQSARAVQAARLGIERGLYSVHQQGGACPAGPNPAPTIITGVPGLNGFMVSWTCVATSIFNENGVAVGTGTDRHIYTITSTACSPVVAACPSISGAEQQSNDYVERQLVVVTEQ